jgi:hypothetical protein
MATRTRKQPAERDDSKLASKLTEADLELALVLLREGQRQTTIAKRFGVSDAAMTQRRQRDQVYSDRWDEADAEGEFDTVRQLNTAMGKGLPCDAIKWKLEHRYGFLDPMKRAKIANLRASTELARRSASTDDLPPDPRFE